jgi:hypothetical protein
LGEGTAEAGDEAPAGQLRVSRTAVTQPRDCQNHSDSPQLLRFRRQVRLNVQSSLNMIPPPETTKSVPLQLDDFYLTKLHVEWVPMPTAGEFQVQSVNLRLTYDLMAHSENDHTYKMALKIEGEDVCEKAPGCGLNFSAIIVGEYRIEGIEAPQKEGMLARINGVSLLFSTFRGILGSVSGAFQHGRFVLPSIDPRAVVAEVEMQNAAKAEASQTTAKIPEVAPAG